MQPQAEGCGSRITRPTWLLSKVEINSLSSSRIVRKFAATAIQAFRASPHAAVRFPVGTRACLNDLQQIFATRCYLLAGAASQLMPCPKPRAVA